MTELILLGTYHFSGEKDIFSSSMQKELKQFIERISKLCPTKIAVQIPIRHDEGTQLLLQWYERNLMIYSNLQNLAEDGDRILLLIGSGRLKLLRELVLADPHMDYLDWTELI